MIRVTNYFVLLIEGKFNTQTYANVMGPLLHMYRNKLHQSRICIMMLPILSFFNVKLCSNLALINTFCGYDLQNTVHL